MTPPSSTPSTPSGPAPESGTPAVDNELIGIRRRWIGPLLALIAVIYCALGLVWLGGLTPVRLDLSFPEGQMAERARQVVLGRPVFEEWNRWPHPFSPYGPLFFYPPGWVARALIAHPSIDTLYRAGRWQSLLALLGIGVVLWDMGRLMRMSRGARIVALALSFIWLPLMEYALSFRPDAPAAFWLMLALWFAIRGPARRLPIAGALTALMLALWTKLTAISMLPFFYVWLAAAQGWRRATAILTLFGAVGLVAAVTFNAATGGMFFHNILGGAIGQEGYSLAHFTGRMTDLWGRPALALTLGVAAAVFTLATCGDRSRRWLAAGALVSLAAILPMLPKVGSDKIYFLPPFLLLNLVSAATFDRLWRQPGARLWIWREAVLWCLAIMPPMWIMGHEISQCRIRLQLLSSLRGETNIFDLIQECYPPGPMLSVVNYVALRCSSEPAILDHFAYTAVIVGGKGDTAPLDERIRNEHFDLVLLYSDDLTPSSDPAKRPTFGRRFPPLLLQHYRVVARPDPLLLLEPIHRKVTHRRTVTLSNGETLGD